MFRKIIVSLITICLMLGIMSCGSKEQQAETTTAASTTEKAETTEVETTEEETTTAEETEVVADYSNGVAELTFGDTFYNDEWDMVETEVSIKNLANVDIVWRNNSNPIAPGEALETTYGFRPSDGWEFPYSNNVTFEFYDTNHLSICTKVYTVLINKEDEKYTSDYIEIAEIRTTDDLEEAQEGDVLFEANGIQLVLDKMEVKEIYYGDHTENNVQVTYTVVNNSDHVLYSYNDVMAEPGQSKEQRSVFQMDRMEQTKDGRYYDGLTVQIYDENRNLTDYLKANLLIPDSLVGEMMSGNEEIAEDTIDESGLNLVLVDNDEIRVTLLEMHGRKSRGGIDVVVLTENKTGHRLIDFGAGDYIVPNGSLVREGSVGFVDGRVEITLNYADDDDYDSVLKDEAGDPSSTTEGLGWYIDTSDPYAWTTYQARTVFNGRAYVSPENLSFTVEEEKH